MNTAHFLRGKYGKVSYTRPLMAIPTQEIPPSHNIYFMKYPIAMKMKNLYINGLIWEGSQGILEEIKAS